MMRYHINFEERMLEPTEHGKWVKFEDVERIEAGAREEAERNAESLFQAELQTRAEKMGELHQTCEVFKEQVDALKDNARHAEHILLHHQEMLRAAKHRLKLLGHAPNCQSRYGAVTSDGQEIIRDCTCGLDEWFRESGIG